MRDPEIVGSFICYFWVMTILSSQKLKNAKYSFWLQKGVKNLIWQNILSRNPQIVGGFSIWDVESWKKLTKTAGFFHGKKLPKTWPVFFMVFSMEKTKKFFF